MKLNITIFTLVFSLLGSNVFSQTPTFQALLQNTSGTQQNEIYSITSDNNGNAFFCGRHTDTLKFGSLSLLPGQGGAFWGKADATGNVLWLRQGGTQMPSADKAYGITIDQNGDVYVCGAIAGFQIATFNATPLSTMYPGFVLKYSNSGNFIWATGIGSNVFSISIDNSNSPIINSGDQTVFKLNPTTGAEISSPSGSISGNLQNPHFHNITIDNSNNIIVQAGNKVVKFDNNFNLIWSTPITSSLVETFQINLDINGNIFGTFYALFGTVTLGSITKSNFPNGYLYKLDAISGNPIFVDSVLIGGNASKIKEVIPRNGNYYISGDGAFNTAHVLKITPSYSVLWNKTLSNKAPLNDIHYISENCLLIGGKHNDTITLDSYTLTLPNGITNTDNSFFATLCAGNVGIAEHKELNTIELFPNPFSHHTTLQIDNLLKNATLTVYNLYGQIVKQMQNISGQTITLQRNDLPSGLYFISLTQDNKIIASDKLLVTD